MSFGQLPPRTRILFGARLALLAVALGTNLLLLAGFINLVLSLSFFASATSLYALLTAVWWRCPSCGKYPGNSVMPDFCESCGSALFGHDRKEAVSPSGTVENPERRVAGLLVARTMYGALLVAVFGVWGPAMEHAPAVFWSLTIAFMAFGAWAEWRWWRCPHCRAYLPRGLWPGWSCNKCGGVLIDRTKRSQRQEVRTIVNSKHDGSTASPRIEEHTEVTPTPEVPKKRKAAAVASRGKRRRRGKKRGRPRRKRRT
jgi:predicted RNA-binding Zn-ribbon protein involved in translation (DUF1610 family)